MKDDLNLVNLETYYNDIQLKQIEVETRLKKTKTDIESLFLSFNEDLSTLKDIQQINNSLKEKIFELKKEKFIETINSGTFKNIAGIATPFFSKLKETVTNKTREVIEYVDGTTSNNKWIDEQYLEYKQLCIKNCEEIKSKEEFQLVAINFKDNVQNEKIGISNILEKATNEVSQVTHSLTKAVANIDIENKLTQLLKPFEDNHNTIIPVETEVVLVDNKLDKKTILLKWIQDNSVTINTLTNTKIVELYEDYLLYILKNYSSNNPDYIYSDKNGVFTTALKRNFPNIIIDKDNKTINITSKTV